MNEFDFNLNEPNECFTAVDMDGNGNNDYVYAEGDCYDEQSYVEYGDSDGDGQVDYAYPEGDFNGDGQQDVIAVEDSNGDGNIDNKIKEAVFALNQDKELSASKQTNSRLIYSHRVSSIVLK